MLRFFYNAFSSAVLILAAITAFIGLFVTAIINSAVIDKGFWGPIVMGLIGFVIYANLFHKDKSKTNHAD